jgi:protease secretion system membrane fusion protein
VSKKLNQPSITHSDPITESTNASLQRQKILALADTRRVARVGLLTLLFGFGGFLAWSALVPLDQGVPSLGTVYVDTKRKTVQHLQGGIVQQVLVREGQWVEMNQPLLRLDDSVTRANYEGVRQQLYSMKTVEARLVAEQLGQSKIAFDSVLTDAARADHKLSEQMDMQSQLLQARRQSIAAALSILRESANGQEAVLNSANQIEGNLKLQAHSLENELQGVRDLAKEGYLPMSRQLEMERQLTSLRSQIAETVSNQVRARHAILEIRQRETATRADYRKEVEQQLSQLRPEIQALTERFKAISEELDRVVVRSPAKGQVVGLSAQTIGGVIGPGQRVMDIVPAGESLVVEARVESHMIDKVLPGSAVDLRFATFANTPQLVVPGRIMTLSSDTVTDPEMPQLPPHYRARIEVTPDGIKELGSRRLQPGMPVDVIFKTGQRTLLDYILHPLTKRLATSMKEE